MVGPPKLPTSNCDWREKKEGGATPPFYERTAGVSSDRISLVPLTFTEARQVFYKRTKGGGGKKGKVRTRADKKEWGRGSGMEIELSLEFLSLL